MLIQEICFISCVKGHLPYVQVGLELSLQWENKKVAQPGSSCGIYPSG